MIRIVAAGAALALAFTPAALANDRGAEFRLGVTAHDLADHVEDGPNITFGYLFESPDFLGPVWSPRPYVYMSWNTNSLTNFGGAGLSWTVPLGANWNGEVAFGLAYHDGVNDIDRNAPPHDPTRIRLATTRALLGNHILFHTVFGLDYDISDQLSIGVYYEHISHGQILGSGRNQALDNAGVRVGYRWR